MVMPAETKRMIRALPGALMAVGLAVALSPTPAKAACPPCYTFYTIDNPLDPNFNQLLGINRGGVIVGYWGDGTVVPNKGQIVVPVDHYAAENFPKSAQTQVVGINNENIPVTVGFYIDGTGNNFGFVNVNRVFTSVKDPHTPTSGITTNQLLGVNDNGDAAGFYNDSAGNSHGYIYNISSKIFTEITLPKLTFPSVVSFQVTGINDAGIICGFWSNGTVTHAFVGQPGVGGVGGPYRSISIPGSMLFGINNSNVAVGTYPIKGVSQGFVYSVDYAASGVVNDPLASVTSAFGINGTTINGINDNGSLVGFYSDGTHVNGFLAVPSD
jgi:hypothetical protein